MASRPTLIGSARFALRHALALCATLSLALILCADTPGNLSSPAHPSACSCKCMQGQTHAGCSRICDTQRRASRWGANSCAKPRLRKPVDNHGAGPRLPHPPRAERASL